MRSFVPFAALLSVVQAVSMPSLLGRVSQDICKGVTGPVKLETSPKPIVIGSIVYACLCLSNIQDFINTDPVASIAATTFGYDVTRSAFELMVTDGGKKCTRPGDSSPKCSPGDVCGFSCLKGFIRSGDKCECPAPMLVCNGWCSEAISCPSSTPERRRARNLWQKRMSCDVGFTACGTTSSYRKTLGAYDCVDTQTDLESCGGCNIPLHEGSPRGRDCSSIPGVADVACYNGACKIYECMPGYTLSSDQSTCHSEAQLKIIQELAENTYKMAIDFI